MTQEFVTLPREVVELAIETLLCTDSEEGSTAFEDELKAVKELRAALRQPQNHVPDAGNMVPAGWKLVPVDPTQGMIEAGKDAHYEAEKRIQQPDAWKQGGFAKRAVRAAHVFQAMLDAAPQPQALDRPQVEQPAMTPIAQRKLEDLMASGYTISGYSVYREQKHQHGFVTGAGLVGWWTPEGVEYPQPQGEQKPVAEHELKDVRCECCGYMTHHREHMGCIRAAQPKREPLTHYEIHELFRRSWDDRQDGDEIKAFARAIEAAHNIK